MVRSLEGLLPGREWPGDQLDMRGLTIGELSFSGSRASFMMSSSGCSMTTLSATFGVAGMTEALAGTEAFFCAFF